MFHSDTKITLQYTKNSGLPYIDYVITINTDDTEFNFGFRLDSEEHKRLLLTGYSSYVKSQEYYDSQYITFGRDYIVLKNDSCEYKIKGETKCAELTDLLMNYLNDNTKHYNIEEPEITHDSETHCPSDLINLEPDKENNTLQGNTTCENSIYEDISCDAQAEKDSEVYYNKLFEDHVIETGIQVIGGYPLECVDKSIDLYVYGSNDFVIDRQLYDRRVHIEVSCSLDNLRHLADYLKGNKTVTVGPFSYEHEEFQTEKLIVVDRFKHKHLFKGPNLKLFSQKLNGLLASKN